MNRLSLSRKRLLVIQTCVPDYRLGLFTALAARSLGLTVASGMEYFAPSIRDAASGQAWSVELRNKFLFGRRFAWLGRPAGLLTDRSVVVHEWNPRILSFWRDLLVCRCRGIPVIVWGHAWGKDGPSGLMCWLRQWMARRADGVICYTDSQAEFVRKTNRGLPAIAAPNACLSHADWGGTGKETDRDAIIYVGRLVRQKKVGLLLEGFASACGGSPTFGARLMIVGDGPEREALIRRAADLNVSERVVWFGHQAATPVLRSAYSRAFVSVSAGYVGLSLTQSFAFGVPALIARDEPHSPEIEAAREGINARFFASDDPADLAAKLSAAWVEWRGIEEKRQELSAWTAENYSFEKMAERFCAMTELVTRRAGGASS